MEKLAYTILQVLALFWLGTMVLGMVTVLPYRTAVRLKRRT